MFSKRLSNPLCAVALLAILGLALLTHAQLQLVHEIDLPVQPHAGTFGGGFLAIGFSSGELFQFRVAPDQSLLILYPGTNGKWPLIRLRKWWTATPAIEELDLPSWTMANTRYKLSFGTDLLITADGRYAVAMGSALSVKEPANIPFPPAEPIGGKPDLLIEVVNLNRWQIVGALHTATVDPSALFEAATTVNGRWLALQGYNEAPEKVKYEHLYDRINRLISISDLKPGPGCTTKSPDSITLGVPGSLGPAHTRALSKGTKSLSQQNDAACPQLLAAAGVPSMRVLDWLIYLGHDPEPADVKVHIWPSFLADQQERDKEPAASNLVWPLGEFDQGSWPSNEWDIYEDTPPFESSKQLWYQLRLPGNGGSYDLNEYTSAGQPLKSQETDITSSHECARHYQCACQVADVSEQQGALLAFCRKQSVNFTGSFDWHEQWIAVFRTDDLSEIGAAELSKNSETRVALAAGDGTTYAVAAERGRVVRVYAVPKQ